MPTAEIGDRKTDLTAIWINDTWGSQSEGQNFATPILCGCDGNFSGLSEGCEDRFLTLSGIARRSI